jgi:hypothetical protein
LNKDVEKGNRALCALCELTKPTNLPEAIEILNIVKEKSEEVIEEFSEKFLTPFDNVMKLLNSVKKQFL